MKFWGLGNEIYGDWQMGHKTAEECAHEARRAAKIMRAVDPNIKLAACGAKDPEWDRVVLHHLYDVVDFISIHHYTHLRRGTYEEEVGSVAAVERWIGHLAALIDIERRRRNTDHRVAIAFDEWNVMYGALDPDENHKVCTVAEMLFVASFLIMLQRKADVVKMANLAQMVNVIAPHQDPAGRARSSGYLLAFTTLRHPLRGVDGGCVEQGRDLRCASVGGRGVALAGGRRHGER